MIKHIIDSLVNFFKELFEPLLKEGDLVEVLERKDYLKCVRWRKGKTKTIFLEESNFPLNLPKDRNNFINYIYIYQNNSLRQLRGGELDQYIKQTQKQKSRKC